MDRTVIASFCNNYVERVCGLTQWDNERILEIRGLDLPEKVQIHFSLDETCGTSLRVWGETNKGITIVKIPQVILEKEGVCANGYRAYAFIYLTDNTGAMTVRKIIFEIKTRPRPDDYIVDPEGAKLWSQLELKLDELDKKAVKTVNGRETDEEGNVDLGFPTEDETLSMLAEADIINLATDGNDDIFTDANKDAIVF